MMNDPKKSTEAILITGPTASGKSALALALARRHGGVVINADSMQVYDTLRVITARPSLEEMEGVEHRLYGHVSASLAYSTGAWLRDVESVLVELRGRGLMPVIVGGTGLYFKALTGGLSDMPAISPEIRALFRQKLVQEGAQALHSHLSQVDPRSAEGLGENDGQRIVRALEVHAATGQSIREFQARTGPVLVDAAKAAKYLVLPDRNILYDRIDRRFSEMMTLGAVEEVRALLAMKLSPDLPAMRAIGVSQIAAMLEGKLQPDEAVRLAATATRQYAKRQMTWFRNQMDESWQRGDAARLLSS
ncbi:tRNA (adenosine(37)-N6)-dimethylallyltransferase MiaA [Peteryoungia ipomoeae]|uniref:tRNA dimethylallyltransferase n=1 Tax=Peteryoungia ipomoeae TaxID=1210932 RepID=A0A4V4HNE6_9HYPH|nr:tRNA (adenosine(37)-N6)-dimethylallyltransferase MiaA [Peteryoungia ipomoeae]THV25836.1 tRNA (adenosine(37)-N6)-dimethylallyltransferase MiaA [Peteryoungia ipomoeae]